MNRADAVANSSARTIEGAGTPPRDWQADPALAAVAVASVDQLVPPGWRAVLVAPHPDDEVLACGALLQLLASRQPAPLLVAVTDGEASHPGSTLWPPERLRQARPRESLAALQTLGLVQPCMLRLGVADGAVGAAEHALGQRLAALLCATDVVISTWRHDGHPDHEACARACASATAATGARLLEVPAWGWHWSAPAEHALPLARARKLALTSAHLHTKRAAMACFSSQTSLDPSTGAGAILPAQVLARLLTPFEVYFL
ncbi:PIG-L deacetylase family protein [Massilia sp. PWRC2]|uniref:PIG-L deacetylase family protein n=1 Tax=Massilia sp. PWRC2 TaxID=2804626 RepID=UPI003CF442F8